MEPWREELLGERERVKVGALPSVLQSPPSTSHWLNLRRKQVAKEPGKRCLPASAESKTAEQGKGSGIVTRVNTW